MREEFPAHNQIQNRKTGKTAQDRGFQMRLSDVEGCAEQLKATLSPGTAARYRKALLDFFDYLPEDKRVGEDTAAKWLESLRGRYSNYQVNMATSAYNALMRYTGHEEYLLTRYIVKQVPSQKVVTREGYLRLLAAARRMRKPIAYLAMRTYACTGMDTSELLALTVEEVRDGTVTAGERVVHLPASLQKELLDYALHSGVRRGRIFISRTGQPMKAETVRMSITAVSKAAGFTAREACAQTLQKLYETTRSELMAKAAERLMLEQAEREQLEHGWGERPQ